ncbi:MAG: LysR family transcriptional regulator [Bacteroidales bacterium]
MIEIECNITIKKEGKNYLNALKVNLLHCIQQTGSLSGAAKKLGISYQFAWNMIEEINSTSNTPLVVLQRGGVNGGGAVVTDTGLRFIKEYKYIEDEVNRLIGKIISEINF